MAASIAGDLDDAAARQLRHGSGGRRTGDEQPLPVDLRASEAADALHIGLCGCVRLVMRPPLAWPADTISGYAGWLGGRIGLIRRSPSAAVICETIHVTVSRCVSVLDGPPERHPAGNCAACGAQLLAPPGADSARCRGCGEIATGIAESRAKRAAQADVIASAEEIAVRLRIAGYPVAAGTIRMWKTRQRIAERPGGGYALGEVLELVRQRDERQAGARR
jgi:hypothetical protein